MGETFTRRDMADQLADVLDGTIDGEAVLDALVREHGVVDINTIPADEFTAIVAAAPDLPTEAEQAAADAARLHAEARAAARHAAKRAGSGAVGPVTWSTEVSTEGGAIVRVEVELAWLGSLPWHRGRCIVRTPDGEITELKEAADGTDETAAWAPLRDALGEVAEQWVRYTEELRERAQRERRLALHHDAMWRNAVLEAAAAGVTYYRLAKDLGLAESTIARIVERTYA